MESTSHSTEAFLVKRRRRRNSNLHLLGNLLGSNRKRPTRLEIAETDLLKKLDNFVFEKNNNIKKDYAHANIIANLPLAERNRLHKQYLLERETAEQSFSARIKENLNKYRSLGGIKNFKIKKYRDKYDHQFKLIIKPTGTIDENKAADAIIISGGDGGDGSVDDIADENIAGKNVVTVKAVDDEEEVDEDDDGEGEDDEDDDEADEADETTVVSTEADTVAAKEVETNSRQDTVNNISSKLANIISSPKIVSPPQVSLPPPASVPPQAISTDGKGYFSIKNYLPSYDWEYMTIFTPLVICSIFVEMGQYLKIVKTTNLNKAIAYILIYIITYTSYSYISPQSNENVPTLSPGMSYKAFFKTILSSLYNYTLSIGTVIALPPLIAFKGIALALYHKRFMATLLSMKDLAILTSIHTADIGQNDWIMIKNTINELKPNAFYARFHKVISAVLSMLLKCLTGLFTRYLPNSKICAVLTAQTLKNANPLNAHKSVLSTLKKLVSAPLDDSNISLLLRDSPCMYEYVIKNNMVGIQNEYYRDSVIDNELDLLQFLQTRGMVFDKGTFDDLLETQQYCDDEAKLFKKVTDSANGGELSELFKTMRTSLIDLKNLPDSTDETVRETAERSVTDIKHKVYSCVENILDKTQTTTPTPSTSDQVTGVTEPDIELATNAKIEDVLKLNNSPEQVREMNTPSDKSTVILTKDTESAIKSSSRNVYVQIISNVKNNMLTELTNIVWVVLPVTIIYIILRYIKDLYYPKSKTAGRVIAVCTILHFLLGLFINTGGIRTWNDIAKKVGLLSWLVLQAYVLVHIVYIEPYIWGKLNI